MHSVNPHPPLRGSLSQRERDLVVDSHKPVRNPGELRRITRTQLLQGAKTVSPRNAMFT